MLSLNHPFFVFLLVRLAIHPHAPSDPATKEYVDGNTLKSDIFYQNSFSSISSNGVALGFKMENLLSFMKEHNLIYIEIIGASSNGGAFSFFTF